MEWAVVKGMFLFLFIICILGIIASFCELFHKPDHSEQKTNSLLKNQQNSLKIKSNPPKINLFLRGSLSKFFSFTKILFIILTIIWAFGFILSLLFYAFIYPLLKN